MNKTKTEITESFLYYFHPGLPIMCGVGQIDDKYYLVPLKPRNVGDIGFDTFMKQASGDVVSLYNRFLGKENYGFITCLSDIGEPYFQDEFLKSWYSWMYTHLVLKSKKKYIEFDNEVATLNHYSGTVSITLGKEIEKIDDYWHQKGEDNHFSKERKIMAHHEREYLRTRRFVPYAINV